MEPSKIREHVADLQAEAEALESRLSGIRKLLEAYAEVYPDLGVDVPTRTTASATHDDDAPGDLIPKGQDAVRRVLYESSGEWFTVTRMATEMRRRGWISEDPEAGGAVRAALARVEKSDPLIFKGQGAKTGAITYSYRPFEYDKPMNENDTESGPTLRDALWKALEDGSRLTVQEARRRAEQLGWKTASQHPHTRIRNTFRSMLDEGTVEREGDKYFRGDVVHNRGLGLVSQVVAGDADRTFGERLIDHTNEGTENGG